MRSRCSTNHESSAAAWRARLEARFAVNGFLRWLALNTIVGNFDAYGGFRRTTTTSTAVPATGIACIGFPGTTTWP